MKNKELLLKEIKRLKHQLNSLNILIEASSEIIRIKGKREGIKLAIGNLEETLKDLENE